MESMMKIAATAAAAALCAAVVKKQTPEIALVISLFAGALILSFAVPAFKSVKQLTETLSETAGLAPAVVAPVIKTVGISILTKVTAEICRDAGEGGLAAFTEIAGAAGALLVCLPLMEMALQMVVELL